MITLLMALGRRVIKTAGVCVVVVMVVGTRLRRMVV